MRYRMTRKAFNAYLQSRTNGEKKMNPYMFVIDYLNRAGGYKDKITGIVLSD